LHLRLLRIRLLVVSLTAIRRQTGRGAKTYPVQQFLITRGRAASATYLGFSIFRFEIFSFYAALAYFIDTDGSYQKGPDA